MRVENHDLTLTGMRAVELARLTQGLPGWPGLHRCRSMPSIDGCTLPPPRCEPVLLAEVESDLAAGWSVDSCAYPVPRERIEAELPTSLPASGQAAAWWDKVSAALRGVEWAIFDVACELAKRDRDNVTVRHPAKLAESLA